LPDPRPRRLTPRFVERIWGTSQLEPWFRNSDRRIGEVWFQTDPPLSLLTKFIFTSERLSVQVHPNDAQARERGLPNGKTEMWHILAAEPGATVALGFREPVTHAQIESAARSGDIEQMLEWIPVAAGDTVFVPAGTVHALGAGLAVVEIQQHADTTYRLWDYGRGRELHLDDGVAVADPGPALFLPQRPANGSTLASCEYFETELMDVQRERLLPAPRRSYALLIPIAGQGRLADQPYKAGEVWLLEEGTPDCLIQAETPSRFLRSGPPERW
jgi:mannose-6-phosphate isomerase